MKLIVGEVSTFLSNSTYEAAHERGVIEARRMALSKINAFNWDKLLSKVDSADVKRSVNFLRGKANEIAANSGKYAKAPAAIDFGMYKKKLKFTAAAVETLEKTYKSKSLPTYSASLPPFEAKKRAMLLSVVRSTVGAAKADLESLNAQLSAFEDGRITTSTSVGELRSRFPTIAKEIEAEIRDHQWAKDSH